MMTTTTDRAALAGQRIGSMERRLRKSLNVISVLIDDDGARHAGHAGARDGRGHFNLTLISNDFDTLGRLARHRLIYQALGDMMDTDIHALSIVAQTLEEAHHDN